MRNFLVREEPARDSPRLRQLSPLRLLLNKRGTMRPLLSSKMTRRMAFKMKISQIIPYRSRKKWALATEVDLPKD